MISQVPCLKELKDEIVTFNVEYHSIESSYDKAVKFFKKQPKHKMDGFKILKILAHYI